MSAIFSVAPMVKALMTIATVWTPGDVIYTPTNNSQSDFVANYLKNSHNQDNLYKNNIRILNNNAYNSTDNKTGYDITATLDIDIQWLAPVKTVVRSLAVTDYEVDYKILTMTSGFSVYTTDEHSNPLVAIATRSGDRVWMTKVEQFQQLQDFDLLRTIEQLSSSTKTVISEPISTLMFPAIHYNNKKNMSWSKGLYLYDPYNSDYMRVHSGIDITRLSLDTHQSTSSHSTRVVAGSLSRSHKKYNKPIYLDSGLDSGDLMGPIFCWIERPGIQKPLCAAYLNEDCWVRITE